MATDTDSGKVTDTPVAAFTSWTERLADNWAFSEQPVAVLSTWSSAVDWPLATERVVGRGSGTYADTWNRAVRTILTRSAYTPDAAFFGYPIGAKSYNAAAFPGATGAAQLTAAIAQAAFDGVNRVWCPATLIPFVAANVVYNAAVQVTFETEHDRIALAWSATPTFDGVYGGFELWLQDNVTSSTLVNVTPGHRYRFWLKQASGSKTFVWPTNVRGGMVPGPLAGTVSQQEFEAATDGVVYATGPGMVGL